MNIKAETKMYLKYFQERYEDLKNVSEIKDLSRDAMDFIRKEKIKSAYKMEYYEEVLKMLEDK